LNEPNSEAEVVGSIASLQANKAADAFGITAECLKNASVKEDKTTRLLLAPILTRIYNQILDNPDQYPYQFQINSLTPIYKGKGDPKDMNSYRGIAVGSIVGKVFERVLYKRANQAAEENGLRAKTQCGFRKDHGTLDNMFIMQHLINKHRHLRKRLFCLLIDFEKAFDTVPRAELLERCRLVGIQGKFMQAIVAMYDKILMAVKLRGRLEPAFETTQGTKQGGELSPLLFGLFIEQLHDLILAKCPGVGPEMNGMRVPDLLYADDATLLATRPEHIEQLLACLKLFCKLFGMRVNVSKTLVVIFRSPKHALTKAQRAKFAWSYAGERVRVETQCKFLGSTLHNTKRASAATVPLAASGCRAMHALLTSFRGAHITQSDFQVRLFHVLVEPVLSYGCQVWAPDVFTQFDLDPAKLLHNPQEEVLVDFLRILAGLPKSAKKWVLLREFGTGPLHARWMKLCARFWVKILQMPSDRLLHQALLADIDLYLTGCRDCWTSGFLSALRRINIPIGNDLSSRDAITRLAVEEEEVMARAAEYFADMWKDLPEPAGAPSEQVVLSTYHHWVAGEEIACGAPHLKSFLPRSLKTCLTRLRVGTHDLHIHTGRYTNTPREQRTCRVCLQPGVVEDLQHFICDCPTYASVRDKNVDIFVHAATSAAVLAHPDQYKLAKCLSDMLAVRQATLDA
jgi:hypothetical protein